MVGVGLPVEVMASFKPRQDVIREHQQMIANCGVTDHKVSVENLLGASI